MTMIDIRKEASDELASNWGSKSETSKLDIHTKNGPYGCYVTTVFKASKQGDGTIDHRLTYLEVRLDGAWNSESRSYIELVCRQGYALVRSGVWTSRQLAKSFLNYNFPPQGVCPQLGSIAQSPLDAVGKLIFQRLEKGGSTQK